MKPAHLPHSRILDRARVVGSHILFPLALLAACLRGGLSLPAAEPVRPSDLLSVDAGRAEFTLILLPDTQRYAKNNPAIFLAQTHWIRENHPALNTRFVIHLGDITNNNTDEEWRVADQAMSVLDNRVPYLILPGNHDYEKHPENGWRMKLAPKFNAVFGPLRFRDKPWYGGHRGVTNENSYCFFSAAGRDFMILGLEFGPTDEVLEWAAQLLRAHPNKKVIVATHCYMYNDDTRLGPGDESSPHKSQPSYNDGEQIWEKFVRHHPNIFMVVSGHVSGNGTGRLSSKGDHGNVVHQLLSDYQDFENGGNGWLRILKFAPEEGKILVRTYSPWLKKFYDDARHSFDLDLKPRF